MRFREFNIIKEAKTDDFYTVGDSHARGVGTASGLDDAHNLAVNGAATTGNASTTQSMLANISKIPKGANVLICVGANDTANVVRANLDSGGKIKLPPASKIVGDVMKVVNAVKAQGATNIVFMLFPSGDNKKTQYYAGDFQGEVRDALKAAVGVKVIDYDGSALQNDGVHYQFGVYKKAGDEVRKIFGPANGITLGPSDATPGALTTKDKAQVQDVAMRAFRTDGSFYVPPLIGNKGPEIADLQKALVALGYQLPKYGVDGIMGKETKTAIQAFQSDKQLHTDGIAGKDTLAALNKAITDNPKVASSLRKSTQADVKSRVQNIATGDAKGGSGATGSAMTAVKFFINKGWTPEQSAGIVGNLQAESGKDLQVDIVGDNGQAYGIAQWHPPRQASFRKTIGKDIVGSTLQDQLSFVDWELNNTESNAGRQLKTAKTAEEAAWIMDEYYERSSGAHRQKRINNAVALLPQSTTTA